MQSNSHQWLWKPQSRNPLPNRYASHQPYTHTLQPNDSSAINHSLLLPDQIHRLNPPCALTPTHRVRNLPAPHPTPRGRLPTAPHSTYRGAPISRLFSSRSLPRFAAIYSPHPPFQPKDGREEEGGVQTSVISILDAFRYLNFGCQCRPVLDFYYQTRTTVFFSQ
ncbi:hypothetical protein BS50DRAFT_347006 [Corynespora cassiicola Philippines]|uniref:Uncharacterized protein n=1 Tax=Corynespora cassiicola Philippines TaxID=1448308 RepID=A0A2T2NQG2_CORCC|nr:hypothetical protein BS50DRAFT_347006 [Corynespora cassiicola Philippines]